MALMIYFLSEVLLTLMWQKSVLEYSGVKKNWQIDTNIKPILIPEKVVDHRDKQYGTSLKWTSYIVSSLSVKQGLTFLFLRGLESTI